MIAKILLAVVSTVSVAIAGDYGIKLSDDRVGCSSKGLPSWPVYSPKEVAADLKTYFSDGSAKISKLKTYLGNGSVVYCGSYDAAPLYETFVDLCKSGASKNKKDLSAFLKIVDRKKLNEKINQALANPKTTPKESIRLGECLAN